MFYRRWAWMAAGVGGGIALGVVYFLLATVKYESTAQVLVMRKDSKLAARGVENNNNDSEARVSEDLLATHVQIFQSPQIVGTALRRHGYDQLPSIVDHLERDQTPVEFVIDRLLVTRGGKGQAKTAHVLNASFRHTSDEETQQILDAIVVSYKEFLAEKFQDVSREAADLIKEATGNLATELDDAEQEYRQFREKAPLLWKGDESANVHRVRYEELQSTLSEIRLQLAAAKARMEVVQMAMKEQDARGASEVERLALLDDKHVERLLLLVQVDQGDANTAHFQADQPSRLESAKAEHESLMSMLIRERSLLADLGPKHPQIQDIRRQIAATEEFIKSRNERIGEVEKRPRLTPSLVVQAYLELLRQDIVTLTKRDREILRESETEHEAAKGLVAYELKGEVLRQKVARRQEAYDTVLARLREINLVKDYGGFVTEVIGPVQPGEKVSPKLLLSLLFGGLFGLVLGTGLSLGAEVADRSFHSMDDLHSSTDLPILAMVPNLTPKAGHEPPADSRMAPLLQTHFRPKSREAEAFRGLRTSLFFLAHEQNLRVIGCASAGSGDGKSTMMANLGISIAQSGRKVLIIDADMRRPRQHTLFGLPNSHGLSDAIAGVTELSDAIQSPSIENLSVMTSGPAVANPAELLSSPQFMQVIGVLREKYDFVLVDCPPVLAVADPCIVSSHMDGMLLTVRLSQNNRPQVLRSIEMLEDVGTRIVGMIVNHVQSSQEGGYYRYSYGYGYGYGAKNQGADHYYTSDTQRPEELQQPTH